MALDAAQRLPTHQMTPRSLDSIFGFWEFHLRQRFQIQIDGGKCFHQGCHIVSAELRHADDHIVFAVIGSIQQNMLQPVRSQLVTNPGNQRRQPAFVAHFLLQRFEEWIASFFNPTDLTSLVTRITVQRRQRTMHFLGRRFFGGSL